MSVSLEQIDEMRKRTNCSYQEAKELLEKNNGDLVEAIIEFESKHGYQSQERHRHKNKAKGESTHGRKLRGLLHKGFVTKLIIEKDENTVLNLPVIILIIAVLITMPAFWIYPVAFIVLYFMGFKIRIRKEEGAEVDVNEIVDEFGSKVKTAADKIRRERPTDKGQNNNQSEVNNKDEVKKEDGYNEITVE